MGETYRAEHKVGFIPRAETSAIQGWAEACNNQILDGQKGMLAIGMLTLTSVKIEPSVKATFPALEAGTYYVFDSARFSDGNLIWNVRARLKPGANSITLEQNKRHRLIEQVKGGKACDKLVTRMPEKRS